MIDTLNKTTNSKINLKYLEELSQIIPKIGKGKFQIMIFRKFYSKSPTHDQIRIIK
jgi:hypothetical protein